MIRRPLLLSLLALALAGVRFGSQGELSLPGAAAGPTALAR